MFVFWLMFVIDYYWLKEDGYSEIGGGKVIDLVVCVWISDELVVMGSIVIGLNFGGLSFDNGWFWIEVEGGCCQLVGGGLGVIIVLFEGGQVFMLMFEKWISGWVGKLCGVGGNGFFRMGGEFNVEQ